MKEVATIYRTKPAAVNGAMMPFQDAARRGAGTAMMSMATEVTKLYKSTEATNTKLDKMEARQTKMMNSIEELTEQIKLDMDERDELQQTPVLRTTNDNPFEMFNTSARAPGTTHKPGSSKRKSPERRRAEDMDDGSDREPGEYRPRGGSRRQEQGRDQGSELFLEMAGLLSKNEEGRQTLKNMVAGDPDKERYLYDHNLIQ